MATDDRVMPTTSWDGPSTCPFCGATLPNPGAGFVDHLDESPACADGFETWRDRVAGDMGRGWAG